MPARMSKDSITLNTSQPGSNNVVIRYTFSYDKLLNIGDQIILSLPEWGGIGSINIISCSSTTFTLVSINAGTSNHKISLTVATNNLPANEFCMLDITGMTNPNILRRSNSDAIRHRVLSGSGNMESTSIKSPTRLVVELYLQIQFLKMWELWSKPLCCIILVTTKI